MAAEEISNRSAESPEDEDDDDEDSDPEDEERERDRERKIKDGGGAMGAGTVQLKMWSRRACQGLDDLVESIMEATWLNRTVNDGQGYARYASNNAVQMGHGTLLWRCCQALFNASQHNKHEGHGMDYTSTNVNESYQRNH